MLVRDRMSRKVLTVAPRDTLEHAHDLMHEHGVRHLPIVRGARLAGVLSDRDLRKDHASTTCVQDVMTLNPASISPDASVDEAAVIMEKHKFSALPVVEKARVVGILTTTDVLRAFVALSGAAEPTTRIIVSSKAGRGIERQIRRVVHASHGELKWIHRQGQELHLRLKARHVDEIVTALEAAGFNVSAVVSSPAGGAATERGTHSGKRVLE